MPEEIRLVPPDPDGWAARFNILREKLLELVPSASIEHIGSTAISDLPAKDVVDVLVGVDGASFAGAVSILSSNGFECEGNRSTHAWFKLAHERRRTAVVHVVERCGGEWERRIAFRDILRGNPGARARYLAVKREAAQSTSNWTDYTAHKARIVGDLLRLRRDDGGAAF